MPLITSSSFISSTLRRLPRARLTYALAIVGGLLVSSCGSQTSFTADCSHMNDTWTSYASTFFADNCSQCHGFASSKSAVESQSSAIEERISTSAMPPGGGVSDADRQRIVNWLGCGMP